MWGSIVRASSVLAAAAALAGCASGPCQDSDKACLWRTLRSHPVRDLRFWQADLAKPVAERVGPARPQLVEFITLDNILHGFPQRPRPAAMDAAFSQDVKDAIADLPPEVWRLFGERLVGVYLVDHLGGTGYSDSVLGHNRSPVAGMVVLDASVLAQRTANAWATWKEGTPFKPQEGWRLDARIEQPGQDNRKNAIQYILLHELGHVLSIGGDVHPSWNLDPKEVSPAETYAFFNLSWRIDRTANQYVSVFDAQFPQRKKAAYYFGAKLDAADMAATYANLEATNFPSLYAATSPGDDFAEAFASYVHVVLQKRPWEITISRDGQVVKTFKACWDEPRCGEKRRMLERILRR